MNRTQDITAIVCFSPDEWGDVKRPQQLMQRLAADVPVVYVEPPLCATTLLRRAFAARSATYARRVRRAFSGVAEEMHPGVFVVTPLGLAPDHLLSSLPGRAVRDFVRNATDSAAARRVRAAIGPMNGGRAVAWVGYPTTLHRSTVDASTLVVYDCVDRWSDFPGPQSDAELRAHLADAEADLLATAGVVFCSAEGLLEACRTRASGVVEILRNAADVEHFERSGRTRPADVDDLSGPVLGYIGAIASWVDLGLVRDVATRRPDWSFVIVGPLREFAFNGPIDNLESLSALPNVRMLGARPYEDVPAYLETFDVALIPFKITGLTEDTNPIKLYEYLAGGVQVVSTPLPEVMGVPGVRVADGAEAFERQIEAALADCHDRRIRQLCTTTAMENSWEARARRAWQVLLSADLSVQHVGEPCGVREAAEVRASA